MEPRNFRSFAEIVQKSLIILPFVPDAFWKPPRPSPEPSLSPQEALQSLQEPPFRLPRGLQEAGLQSFLHSWTEDHTSTTKAQCHPCVHTFAVYEYDYNADLSALFQWQMTKHQKQRHNAGTVADQRASGHGYIYIYIYIYILVYIYVYI